ncbi:hypothetical protein EN817_04705 [Mesorhizobium sp. M3A.F.Ca.ET.174.01.1.1]|nr:hypothetical protein EJ074_22460 [Mesorhizobium sp. M3A.F.Ca.ET.080.04.2.1]RWB67273.1 MAG: hypothetical protein EOQ49_25985 [Mesorhizobium sp.]TGS70104.1 hypothetical protein EN844_04930 [Mesorhizobium sp. M3A.F.Ca.ET.201.01.1.1]TGS88086.1 hypothetical protein EN818_04705 [Mesorhizobium sp. M3A.F.Ca.ET.175.01.1.1]TGT29029.1 hypothetical protein EN817_04705 [Mesorhizobium sp. M3A.F.Ca.ET.174.01.1.1]TGT63361.1 hypothetical protein EN813_008115 [Mesorhizobium sp. M00.F.Ca.ET.170.01.1.1]
MVWWHPNLPFLATAGNSSELRHDDNTVMAPDLREDALLPYFAASMQAPTPAHACGDFARWDDEPPGLAARFPRFAVAFGGSVRQPAPLQPLSVPHFADRKKFLTALLIFAIVSPKLVANNRDKMGITR